MHRRRELQQPGKGAVQKPSSLHQTSEISGNGVLGFKKRGEMDLMVNFIRKEYSKSEAQGEPKGMNICIRN